LSSGAGCPCCVNGKLYQGRNRQNISYKSSAPVEVERINQETLRCNSCGQEYVAPHKYQRWESSAKSSILLQRVHGMAFTRMAKLQSLYNLPISASTLWEQCESIWAEVGQYIYEELLKALANSNDIKADDTGAKILSVMALNEEGFGTGRSCHTTVVCGKTEDGNEIVVYLTGQKHCSEHLEEILKLRGECKLNQYIKYVTDASKTNMSAISTPHREKIINGYCLAHGYRKFKEVQEQWGEESSYFMEEIGKIFANERYCVSKGYNKRAKYKYHRKHSRKPFNNIYAKIRELYGKKLVEPSSNLGKAMNYWVNNKKGLGKFLEVKGIELDNNESERELKFIIMQRKNSLFYKTEPSAKILSGLTSIVKSCERAKINVFSYLNWLQDNVSKVLQNPSEWLPWKWRAYMDNTEFI